MMVFSYDQHQHPNIDSEKLNKKRQQSDSQEQENLSKNIVEDVELNQHDDTQIDDNNDRNPSFLQVMKQLSFIDKVIPFFGAHFYDSWGCDWCICQRRGR